MPNDSYPIGYRRPPQHTQFQPGQSGNAKGRPRKEKTSVSEDTSRRLLKLFRSKIEVPNPDGATSKVTILEAYAQKCLQQAVQKGDIRMLDALVKMATQHEAASGEAPPITIRITGGSFDREDVEPYTYQIPGRAKR